MKDNFFRQYLDQPSKLPDKLRGVIEKDYKDNILFYAFCDLDSNLKLTQSWIILGERLYIVRDELVSAYTIDKNTKVEEEFGLVANTLSIKQNDKFIDTLWYGQKQSVSVAQLKFLIEERALGKIPQLEQKADVAYENAVLTPLLNKQSSGDIKKEQVSLRLLSYLLPYKKEFILGAAGAVMMTLISLLPAYLSGKLIDDIIKPFQDESISKTEAMDLGLIFIFTLGVTYFLKEFFIWIRLKKMSILGEKVARDLRDELFKHIQSLDMSFFSKRQTGSIISRVSSDTDRIWDFIAFGVVEVGISTMTLIALMGVLMGLDLKLGIVMSIPVPIFIYSIFKHGNSMQKLFLRCWRRWSELTSILSDTIPGIQVVKAFNQEKKEVSRFNSSNEAVINEFNSIHHSWTRFWPKLMFSIHMLMVLVWMLALPRLLSANTSAEHISAGTFVSFLLYMTMFSQPIEVIGQMSRMLNRATSSAYRIFEILDTKPVVKEAASPIKHLLKGEVRFENVLFSYDGVRNVLKGIDLQINQGEMIGLVGPSGSGKSTIIKLINRFYDITGGEILIDGLNIKDLDIGLLRKQIAVVHQDPFLFHGSILDNIRYGNEKASFKEVIDAAKIANAHEFILKFKDAYETTIGERGQTLSGGERQRISIARAVLNDPKLLILDEATSAVDTETERKIQDALDKLVEGRTVIAIAHRLSTLRKANKIMVIKNGEVVEQGHHQELMAIDGEYKKLQDMQTEMFDLMRLGVEKEVHHEI